MLKPIIWKTLSVSQKNSLLERPATKQNLSLTKKVTELIKKVQSEGDKALYAYTKLFDDVALQDLKVSAEEFEEAENQTSPKLLQTLEEVKSRLRSFHEKQRLKNYSLETAQGLSCERLEIPIQRVGLYVPGGTAPLISTVLMLGLPSELAANPLRILCTPPDKNGNIPLELLVAANLCGIKQIFKVGGAQAIAAMAYGTESIPKVDKIFGPGSNWVTEAKKLVALDPKGAQLDMPAGPSEVLVLADENANPAFIAADLLSQAEHGEDSQVILVCFSENFARAVSKFIEKQLPNLTRKKIALCALKQSMSIIVESEKDAVEFANNYAPEHLIIQFKNPRTYLPSIYTAGSIFLGPWTPESLGDYASGTNHVLPTAGFARSYSGLSLRDFMRSMTVQECSREALVAIAENIRVLTEIEGLDAHRKAVDLRLQTLGVI